MIRCAQCNEPHDTHPAGDGVTECPGDFGVTTTNERLVRELEEAGHDEMFVAEAEAAMLDAMDEMGCS